MVRPAGQMLCTLVVWLDPWRHWNSPLLSPWTMNELRKPLPGHRYCPKDPNSWNWLLGPKRTNALLWGTHICMLLLGVSRRMGIVRVDERTVVLPNLCRHHPIHQELRQRTEEGWRLDSAQKKHTPCVFIQSTYECANPHVWPHMSPTCMATCVTAHLCEHTI